MLKSYEFDIISLSETQLTNNQHQLDSVKIGGYESTFKNRKDKKCGIVGFYIKESITFKTRDDLTKNIVNMEAMFIKLHGRNKNTPYLAAVAQQPSPYESDKLLLLDNFEIFLSEVTTKWDGVIIITGDINIDFIGEKNNLQNVKKNILYSFNLHHHITKPTRKGKSLMYHICSNVPNKLIHNDVMYTNEISDHDTPFVILNIKK